ncbi:MAG: hypothetical protein J6036_02065 [Clostridia bacterium]|nr:hypothetical protein [Clostridia bacterium]
MGKGLFGKLFKNIGGMFGTKAKTGRGKKTHGFFPDPDDPDFEEKMMLIHMLSASGAFDGDDEDLYITEGIYLGDEDSILDELTISTVETEMKPFVDTDLKLMKPKRPEQAVKTAGVDTDFYNFDE